MNITFGSVCSGIEAASVAWHTLGWRPVWLAEIEPFPAKVLHHHYGSGHPHFMPSPDEAGLSDDDAKDRRAAMKSVSDLPKVPLNGSVPPNLGDMTKIAQLVRAGQITAPDVLVGGTPCQAFSIAGLRNSLTDSRGQLSLSFVDLANGIDTVRLVRGKPAAVIVWENVPGVLSTKDNAFGCFLAALAGENEPLQPAGGKWTNAGCVFGPQRAVAWRVLDAQYFGVAQRRRRVFVIASAREGFNPAKVLFEFDSVRRDIAPSRETGKESTAGTLRSTDGGSELNHALAGHIQVAAPVTRSVERPRGDGLDTLMPVTCMAYGQGGAEIASDRAPTLTCNHEAPIAVYGIPGNWIGRKPENGGNAVEPMHDLAPFLTSTDRHGVAAPIAFSSKDYGGDDAVDISPTLRSGNHDKSHANGGNPPAIAFDSRQDPVSSTEVFGALGSTSPQAQAVAFVQNSRDEVRLMGGDGQIVGALAADHGAKQQCYVAQDVAFRACGQDGFTPRDVSPPVCSSDGGGSGVPTAMTSTMAVRRLTPRECERLQAFPDDYTLLPGKPLAHVDQAKLDMDYIKYLMRGGVRTFEECINAAADGPRYKALGNSMCVYNMRWIGARIDAALR